jgi:hypothetical protein
MVCCEGRRTGPSRRDVEYFSLETTIADPDADASVESTAARQPN